MAIRTRGDGLQIDVSTTRDGDKVRYREKFAGTMQAAKAREAAIRSALLSGEDPGSTAGDTESLTKARLPLSVCLEAVWERYWQNASCARTVRSNMRSAIEFFGAGTCITAITTDDADRFVKELKDRELSASTIRSKCAVMTKLFNHYHRRGNISSKPYFEMPKVGDNMRARVLTDAEFDELFRLMLDVWDVAAFRRAGSQTGQAWADWLVFLMDTGCRPSEGRVASTVNLRGRLLTLTQTKTGTTRTLPLSRRAMEAFDRQSALHGAQPFAYATPGAFRHVWDWARATMGMSDDTGFIPYVLRHTCATRLYDKTRDLMVVQRWLGHTDFKMTLRYAKLQPGDLEKACDLLQGEEEAPVERAAEAA
jgi:integrase